MECCRKKPALPKCFPLHVNGSHWWLLMDFDTRSVLISLLNASKKNSHQYYIHVWCVYFSWAANKGVNKRLRSTEQHRSRRLKIIVYPGTMVHFNSNELRREATTLKSDDTTRKHICYACASVLVGGSRIRRLPMHLGMEDARRRPHKLNATLLEVS